ncbi:F-box DNA helicase 1 [Chanos chanos]|uniref:F-box DNA helicase 1 n=1 Tax=Chanos chanos TaxID=29144 RepID=A0A6J2VGI5_CHACN|nr:F-box DNA helicase 1 [Chanos chanos]
METAIKGKAKRRHLSATECVRLGQNSMGSNPLAQPFVSARVMDPNRGLYPKTPTKRRRQDGAMHQRDITEFFPKTGVRVRVSPHKAPPDLPKIEHGSNRVITLKKEEEEEEFEGITAEMFVDDEDFDSPQKAPPDLPKRERGSNRVININKEEEEEELEGITAEMFGDDEDFGSGGVLIKTEDQEIAVGHTGLENSLGHSDLAHVKKEEEDEEEYPVESLPDAHYGLLGVHSGQAEPQGHFQDLPVEVLIIVFGQLPAEDLYRHISLVCRRWRDIVTDPLFLPWKKLYYRYQKQESETVKELNAILTENQITKKCDLCLLNLVRYMSQFKHSKRVNPQDVLLCVRGHRLYVQAEACMKQRMPDLKATEGGPNPWSVMALMLLLADGVKDVLDLVSRLRKSGCLLSLGGISEYLWAVATLLLAMKENGINISSRLHYNIFYVLQLMENSPLSQIRDKSREKMIQVTHEQQQILNHNMQSDHIVKIMAFAGTGKTTTLVKFAEQRPHLRFLYVAFNKSVATQAQRSFPRHVECRTVHSMAFKAVGWRYLNKKKLSSGLKPFSVASVLPKGHGGFVNAKIITQTINTYCCSTDQCIGPEHVPREYKNTSGKVERPDEAKKKEFAQIAQEIWSNMKELLPTRETAYHMTHDGYLKLWHLQRPCLDQYDIICIDEAQDCTPVVMDILLSQPCGKILVGDPHQQIYTFRGAVNALQAVPHTHIYYLTQSFRFGSEIAYVAATALDVCKRVKKILIGGDKESSVRGEDTETLQKLKSGSSQLEGEVAILCRCNASVFSEAVRLTDANSSCKIHIVGGVDNFGLSKIRDIWILMQPEDKRIKEGLRIQDYFIRSFCKEKLGGYRGLKNYAAHTEDRELEGKLVVVERYNTRIPELVERISSCAQSSPENADYILGTVHKSKGLEFDTVVVTDDFAKVPCARHNLQRVPVVRNVPDDEWNLLYVAVTRARRTLYITKTISNLLTLGGEYFLRSELTSVVLNGNPALPCSTRGCPNQINMDTALSMRKLPIRYLDSVEDGGMLCLTCVEQRLGPMAFLLSPPEKVRSMHYTEERVDLPINVAMLLALL